MRQWVSLTLNNKQNVIDESLPLNIVPDEQFFVNFYKGQRKPFGKLINYPGSILDEFSKVTNQRHVTTNKVRASLEPTIQSSHAMKTRSRVVGSHSHETGHRYYDQV